MDTMKDKAPRTFEKYAAEKYDADALAAFEQRVREDDALRALMVKQGATIILDALDASGGIEAGIGDDGEAYFQSFVWDSDQVVALGRKPTEAEYAEAGREPYGPTIQFDDAVPEYHKNAGLYGGRVVQDTERDSVLVLHGPVTEDERLLVAYAFEQAHKCDAARVLSSGAIFLED